MNEYEFQLWKELYNTYLIATESHVDAKEVADEGVRQLRVSAEVTLNRNFVPPAPVVHHDEGEPELPEGGEVA